MPSSLNVQVQKDDDRVRVIYVKAISVGVILKISITASGASD